MQVLALLQERRKDIVSLYYAEMWIGSNL